MIGWCLLKKRKWEGIYPQYLYPNYSEKYSNRFTLIWNHNKPHGSKPYTKRTILLGLVVYHFPSLGFTNVPLGQYLKHRLFALPNSTWPKTVTFLNRNFVIPLSFYKRLRYVNAISNDKPHQNGGKSLNLDSCRTKTYFFVFCCMFDTFDRKTNCDTCSFVKIPVNHTTRKLVGCPASPPIWSRCVAFCVMLLHAEVLYLPLALHLNLPIPKMKLPPSFFRFYWNSINISHGFDFESRIQNIFLSVIHEQYKIPLTNTTMESVLVAASWRLAYSGHILRATCCPMVHELANRFRRHF